MEEEEEEEESRGGLQCPGWGQRGLLHQYHQFLQVWCRGSG